MKQAFIAVFSILLQLLFVPHISANSNFTKYPQNPLMSSSENPNILFKDNVYKMWYTANYGHGWRINYAYSPNGLDNWTIPYQMVITPGTSDGFEMDMANPNVIYNSSLGIYQMWYSSIGHNWAGGSDRFRIGYATSPDGINWTKLGWALQGTEGSWDNGGPARGESVIFNGDNYKMWYAGTNEGLNWRIGYATSSDGINWTKGNSSQPVIIPTEPWELANIEYPNVIYNDGIYEMYYSSGLFDNTTQLIYATSTDGINWTKPLDKNPLLIGAQPYDGITMTSPFALRLNNGTTMLWYGGNVNYIMFAIDSLTPTITPTSIPPATPTPSPSPTPLPPQTNKIVVVPGMGGSWNREALTKCEVNPTNQNWLETFTYYDNLIRRLQDDGLEPYFFAYDWRKPVPENGLRLKLFIDSHTLPGEKIHVVGHSMGGLVARSYLEYEQNNNKLDKLLTAGSPHFGSNLAYPALEGGVSWSDSNMMRAAFTLSQFVCKIRKQLDGVTTIRTTIPSFYNILPVYNYLTDKRTNTIKPFSSMIFKNDWLPTTNFQYPFYGVQVGSLSGSGFETHEQYVTNPPSKKDISDEKWVDGVPVKTITTTAGDRTVLNISSYVQGAQNWTIHEDHGGLATTEIGIQEISHYFTPAVSSLSSPLQLNPRSLQQTEHGKKHLTALVVVSTSGSITIRTPSGENISDKDGFLLIDNPINGKYLVDIDPTEEKTIIYVGQLLENDKVLWKDYTLKKKRRIILNIRYDHDHPKNDPFEDN